MKKRLMILMATAVLAIGGISVVYAQGRNDINSNKSNEKVSYKYTSNFNDMEEIMRENGFSDAAKSMENKDFDSMNKFMNNLTDEDYKKMTDIMKNNGYAPMAKMMESTSRQDMINMHRSMMGR
jgi:alpha-acetolactate decarboxylase